MADEKNLVPEDNQGDIVIYQTEDGGTKIDVRFEGETVWLTQQQMAELFGSSRTNIVEHIRHIYEEGELDEASTCRKFRQVRNEGGRQVSREIPYAIISAASGLARRIGSTSRLQISSLISALRRLLRNDRVSGYARCRTLQRFLVRRSLTEPPQIMPAFPPLPRS